MSSREPDDDAGREKGDLNAAPPGFQSNPGSWRQRVPIAILAALGAVIAAYMALYQWRLIGGVWDPVFGDGSERVLDSHVSHAMRRGMRIPDAALGAVGYLSEAVFALAGSARRWQYRPWMVAVFGIDVILLGLVGILLVVLQGTVVGAWCFLCLVTSAISLILIAMAYREVWASLAYLHRVWKATRNGRLLWRTFWGMASSEADRLALKTSEGER